MNGPPKRAVSHALPCHAKDAVKVAPDAYKVVFENEKFRGHADTRFVSCKQAMGRCRPTTAQPCQRR
jgi:hypothetical protein